MRERRCVYQWKKFASEAAAARRAGSASAAKAPPLGPLLSVRGSTLLRQLLLCPCSQVRDEGFGALGLTIYTVCPPFSFQRDAMRHVHSPYQ